MANQDIPKLVRQWGESDAAGIPLEPLEDRVGLDARNAGSGLTIRPGRPRWRSEIRELKNGQFAFIVPVFIRRDRPGKTIIREAWIGTPWPDTCIEALEDPKYEGKHPGYYNFLPCDTERFVREEVSNHRVKCVLARGDIREGLFLAVGSRPPDAFKDRTKIQVTFGVLDQWDCEHIAKLEMRMNRGPIHVAPILTNKRSRLLARRDELTGTSSWVAPRERTGEGRAEVTEAHGGGHEEVDRVHPGNAQG
jgi:hypothetical protein